MLNKHDDISYSPRLNVKNVRHESLVLGRQRQVDAWDSVTTSLAYLESSRPLRDPASQSKVDKPWIIAPKIALWPLHIHTISLSEFKLTGWNSESYIFVIFLNLAKKIQRTSPGRKRFYPIICSVIWFVLPHKQSE